MEIKQIKVKHWTFRQASMCILILGITILSFRDETAREIYYDLVKFALGGYLGQQIPQGVTYARKIDN